MDESIALKLELIFDILTLEAAYGSHDALSRLDLDQVGRGINVSDVFPNMRDRPPERSDSTNRSKKVESEIAEHNF